MQAPHLAVAEGLPRFELLKRAERLQFDELVAAVDLDVGVQVGVLLA